MIDGNLVSWVVTALSIAGKGFITRIPLTWRLLGFILLGVTGIYWTADLIQIGQDQMALLQMMYTMLNFWGSYNAFEEIRHGKKVQEND